MISAVLILNQRGRILISRAYRSDVDPRTIASGFRSQIIIAKQVDRNPVKAIGSTSFLYISHEDLYLLAVTKHNANAAAVYEFLHQLVSIFKAYFENKFNERTVNEHFVVIYELLDEVADFGYPQFLEPKLLKEFITTQGLRQLPTSQIRAITKQVTGVVSWRKPGIRYRKNEVFIDVIENINMLLSSAGNVLSGEVSGKVIMKAYLTGMPECKLGLNDKLISRSQRPGRFKEVSFTDVVFHQCVHLRQFDSDRTISFIPADGEFELMRYRITSDILRPFRLISSQVKQISSTRLEVRVTIKSVFSRERFGKNVQVVIPLPSNTANCKTTVAAGKAKYKASKSALVWTISRFPGNTELSLMSQVKLIATTVEKKPWSRPPISLNFQIPMFTASGIHVRFLKVNEPKIPYETIKWVRYITQAGTYEQRI